MPCNPFVISHLTPHRFRRTTEAVFMQRFTDIRKSIPADTFTFPLHHDMILDNKHLELIF